MRSNRYFMLGILTFIGVMNFVDRQILSILLESIKVDLNLSDLQLGLLSGTMFAFFYSIIGIPIARLADRWNRSKIISISLFVWSFVTILSGLATSFLHLALARMGIGIGEAGVQPASHALIADRFELHERATAFAVYSCGAAVGVFVALAGGGWVSDQYGWRVAFYAAGIPGVLFALVAFYLVSEPRTSEKFSLQLFGQSKDGKTLTQSLKMFWRSKSWRYAGFAAALNNIAMLGIGGFLPTFMIRNYELSASQTGLIMAMLVGVFGTVGVLAGGRIADKLSKSRGVQWLPWTPSIAYVIVGLLSPIVFMINDLYWFVAMLVPFFILLLTPSGIQFAIAQSMVPSDMRAMSSAALILIINLVGLGLGPVLVGFLSDLFSTRYATDSLRYAIVAVSPLFLIGAYFFYRTGLELPKESIHNELDEKRSDTSNDSQ